MKTTAKTRAPKKPKRPQTQKTNTAASSIKPTAQTRTARPNTIFAQPKPLVPLLPYQKEDIRSSDRFRWNCWSRQTGKSFTKSLRRLLRGITRHRNQLFLSAGERQSRELMEKTRKHCRMLHIASELVDCNFFSGTRYKQLEIRLPNDIRIVGLPANPTTARGFTGDVFLDEFAMHPDDRAIWAAMFPALMRGEGELDVASTPRGVDNVFARLRENPVFAHSTVTLPDAVRMGLNVDIEQMRLAINDDELYRQEFLCEFLDTQHGFLSPDLVSACEDPGLELLTPTHTLRRQAENLFIGMDIGQHRDLTVIWVLAKKDNRLVTRSVIEITDKKFRDKYAALKDLLSLPNVRRCCIDATGIGANLAEDAENDFGSYVVKPIVFTSAIKARLAGRLRVAVEDRAITIPRDDRIRRDWLSLKRRAHNGTFHLQAARTGDGHADRFWAAALALHAADQDPGPAEFLTSDPLNFACDGVW